jgi:ABC-type branched-subunit amino acid transport system ATPase component/ABC-type branched-subunit amino acid transport system permease subunit
MSAFKSAFWTLAVAVVAMVLVGQVNSYYAFVLGQIALLTIVGVGLNVLVGLAGQMSFGHAGLYALGAYTVAILTTRMGVSFWIAWPLGAAIAGAVGALLAIPALRLKGPYLAMVTIAFGLIVENGLVELADLTGGQSGILDIPKPSLGALALDAKGLSMLAIATAAVSLILYMRLSANAWGKALRAVRDSEVAAASIGLNPTVVRTVAFAASAVLAGLAGGLFAPMAGFVTPQTFNLTQSILFVLVIALGGARSNLGPVVGAIVVGLLPELLSSLEAYRILVFGALLLVVLWIAPKGLVGLWGKTAKAPSAPDANDAVTTLDAVLSPRPRQALRAQGLSMTFGGVRAVNDASFQLEPGQITALIGPNGAGKSTVMNLLSGFYSPTEGRRLLGETPLPVGEAFKVARRGVARSYQTSQVFEGMSVEDNVLIALCKGKLACVLGAPASGQDRQRVKMLLHACGYAGDPAIPAGDLAHVDRRLVEIARALATDPDVLLLDEPAAGLSREDKRQLGDLLKAIAAAGVGVGLIEHDMSLVMGVSDTVVVLNAGSQIASGIPKQIQDDPRVREAYLGVAASAVSVSPPRAVSRLDALRVVNLTAGYGAAPVLKHIEIEVRQGEAVALLGANGAGKSTLMRVIAGLHGATEGEVAFEGALLNGLAPHERVRKGVVLVPEGRQVFPELTVADNIRLGAFLDRRDLDTRLAAMLERFPRLAERLHQRAGLLSGGEQQMLALARALMSQPKVLLLDEPSLGLAPKIITEIFEAFRALRENDMTLLVVDQMAGLALSISDRAYVLGDGEILAQGPANQIADDPALAAAYLGA